MLLTRIYISIAKSKTQEIASCAGGCQKLKPAHLVYTSEYKHMVELNPLKQ